MSWGLSDIVQDAPAAPPAAPPAVAPSAPGAQPIQTMTVRPQSEYQTIQPHAAPDGGGSMTNLSDEDYYKFQKEVDASKGQPAPHVEAPQQAAPNTQKPGAWSLMDIVQSPAPQEPSAPPQQTPQQDEGAKPTSWADIAKGFVGSTAATLGGIPRGIVGGLGADYVDAATQTPIRMLTGLQGPGAAFNEGLASARKTHKDLSEAYPIADTAGQLAGAVGSGVLAAPSLAFKAPAVAGLIPKVGAAASYLGRNAAFGGTMAGLNDGDIGTGAAVGGGIAAAIPAVGALARLPGQVGSHLAPLVSGSAREANVGRALAREVQPGAIQTSPVGPLDLAQATNNPSIAAKVKFAQGIAPDAAQTLRNSQQAAVRQQIDQIGRPATAAEASDAFTKAVRSARDLAGKEENRLWTVPELAQTKVSPDMIKLSVSDALDQIDPVLRDSMSPQLKSLVNRAMLAQETTVRDLNGIRSDLEQIARRSQDGGERSMARTLSSAFMKGMDDTVGAGGIASDPAVVAAYQAARDYTRTMRPMFGAPDTAAILNKNAAGVYTKDASEGARGYFNFSNASPEGPKSIAELSNFVGQLRQNGAKGVSDEIVDSARSYIASALDQAAFGRGFSPKQMSRFLDNNGAWMRSSGLFEKPQLEAAEKLLEYSNMLRRTEELAVQGGSQTNRLGETGKTFIDEIIPHWLSRSAKWGGTVAGLTHGGGAGAAIGHVAGSAVEGATTAAEKATRDLMAAVLFDPSVAKDMMMKASAGNTKFFSPATRELMGRLRLAIGSDVLPQNLSGPSKSAAPVSNQ